MIDMRWLDPNKPSRTCTIGYGLTTQDEFVDRLKEAFPDGDAVIIDVRKEGSGSRNAGNWANQGDAMKDTCIKSGNRYGMFSSLANPHGNTLKGLMLYRDELIRGPRRPNLDVLVGMIRNDPERKYCLLCCERKPFAGTFTPKRIVDGIPIGWESWTGKANCHRVIIAGQICMRMRIDHGLEWFTKHLYSA